MSESQPHLTVVGEPVAPKRLNIDRPGYEVYASPALVEALLKAEIADGLTWRFGEIRKAFNVSSSQAGRVADRFAVMALAGELASERGILPWSAGATTQACRTLFADWLATIGDGNAEDRQILTALSDFIALHGDSRFSSIHAQLADTTVRQRAGYFEIEGDKRLYLFNRAALTEAAEGYSRARILRTLGMHDVLAKMDEGRKQKKYRLPGGGMGRFFVVDPDRLDPEGGT